MPDWKPSKRISDSDTLRAFRLQHLNEPCERCELRAGMHVHHRVFRSQGGDDLPENLEWLCMSCHDEAHGIRNVC